MKIKFKEYNWFEFYIYAKESLLPKIPETRVQNMIVMCFMDASLSGKQNDRSIKTKVLAFIDRYPIHWYIKWQTKV